MNPTMVNNKTGKERDENKQIFIGILTLIFFKIKYKKTFHIMLQIAVG
ncbi:MAG: hypothetical protein IJ690_06605 [Clostridia bacterium]|nr:hypothetical protein [Clostridia bacterium]